MGGRPRREGRVGTRIDVGRTGAAAGRRRGERTLPRRRGGSAKGCAGPLRGGGRVVRGVGSVRGSSVAGSIPSAPEKEKEDDDDDDEEEEEEEEEGLAATTDDDEETFHETPPASIPVLRAGDVEIEVTRDATVTVRALGDGRTRRAIRRRSLSASWFPASSATGSRRTGSATATCFVGGGSRSRRRASSPVATTETS